MLQLSWHARFENGDSLILALFTSGVTVMFRLGKVCPTDVVIFFSHSGLTEEVNYAAELVRRKKVPLLAIVGSSGKQFSLCYFSLFFVHDFGK